MKYFWLTCSLLCWTGLTAQNLFVSRYYRSASSVDEARRIIRAPNGNFLVVGYSLPSTTLPTSLNRDGLAFEMDASGQIIWAKLYGGERAEEFYDVVYSGGYYYCVGYTNTFSNDTTNAFQRGDILLVKITASGTLVWSKNFGSTAAGSGATVGNEVGLRLTTSPNGGVVIVARINSGANTNQNAGLISVAADGKVRWAYQYGWSGTNPNELAYGICKDGSRDYIVSGWTDNFSGSNGGMLFKVDEQGDLKWTQYTIGPGSSFESQYFAFYNYVNKKIYSTDFYSHLGGTIREPQVYLNMATTGAVPATGVKARRYHAGAAGSVGNAHRSYIFPIGDGTEEFLLASYDLTTPGATQRKAIITSIADDLTLQWSKKVGHSSGTTQLFDLISCDGSDQDILAVGTWAGASGAKDIIVARIIGSATTSACDESNTVNTTDVTTTNTAVTFQRVNLNTAGCGSSCWADDDMIMGLGSLTITLTRDTSCSVSPPMLIAGTDDDVQLGFPTGTNAPAMAMTLGILPDFIDINECLGLPPLCLNNLSFVFGLLPKETYFEFTDVTGNFIYKRFWNDVPQLLLGFNYTQMGLPPGEYRWRLEAAYHGIEDIEVKAGGVTIN